jgi:hypothetical protein
MIVSISALLAVSGCGGDSDHDGASRKRQTRASAEVNKALLPVRSCYTTAHAVMPDSMQARAEAARAGGYDFLVYLPKDVRTDRKLTSSQRRKLTSCLKQNVLVCIGHGQECGIHVSLPAARRR